MGKWVTGWSGRRGERREEGNKSVLPALSLFRDRSLFPISMQFRLFVFFCICMCVYIYI